MHWLLKSEPDVYSYADLVRDKTTAWTGVANNTALIHLRAARRGDLCLIYHTGDERQAVGVAEVVREAYPDPTSENPKCVAIDIRAKRQLARPVTLAEIKADASFAGWDLLRISRLSVVPTTPELFAKVEALAASGSAEAKPGKAAASRTAPRKGK